MGKKRASAQVTRPTTFLFPFSLYRENYLRSTMASAQQVQGHNPMTCPELLSTAGAEQKADLVRLGNEQLGRAQRGVTPFLNLQLDDLAESAVLMNGDGRDTITYFDSELEAKKYRERLLPAKPLPDFTIPQTAAEHKAHVKVLFKAFKCVPSECLEGENIKKPFVNQVHDNVLVECLCWEILRRCIQRSEVLSNLVESYEPDKYKFKKFTDKNFEQRFDAIVNAMARSKSMCKHMFDVPYLYKVIDDPQTNVERIVSNRKLNGQKAVVMKRGKEAAAEDEEQGRKKKPKTEAAVAEAPSASVLPPPQYQPAPAAPSTTQSSTNIPARQLYSSQQAMSAPGHTGMGQPAQPAYTRQTFHHGGMQNNNNPYYGSAMPNSAMMAPPAMLGASQRPTYTNNYAQSAYMTPRQHATQQYLQMGMPNYPTLSNTRSQQSHSASTSTIRSPSRTSSQYPDPSTPSDQMSTGWLAQPLPETRALNSSYNSSASTVTSPLTTIGQEQPQWPADNFNASDLGETSHTSSETHAQDDGFHSNQDYGHANLEAFLQHAEEENARHAATDNYDDAPFQTDVEGQSHT
ncbi:hypothetical protein PV04_08676 [Phialophora macrospora]|uniref:Uncharacterized protein n=1 Tax=Phialophora macrospora TaxID=1851006 RepID=A0A0D2F6V3_9EURO|nr:hypothetical protein PV04_08676 [Phialophora macrospora]